MNVFGGDASALDDAAHIIQVALTPIFLLSGIATLLNVFSTRLARVADQVDGLVKTIAAADAAAIDELAQQLTVLRRRSILLDAAVVLGAVGGAATCAAVLALFVGSLRDATVASLLFGLFGTAVVCTFGAILAYTIEMLLAGNGTRAKVTASRGIAGQG